MSRLQIFVQLSFLDKFLADYIRSAVFDPEVSSKVSKLFLLLESRVDVHLDIPQTDWLNAASRSKYYMRLIKKSQESQLTLQFYDDAGQWKLDSAEKALLLVDDLPGVKNNSNCFVVSLATDMAELDQVFMAGDFSNRRDLFAFMRKVRFPSDEIFANDRFVFQKKGTSMLQWLQTSSSFPDLRVTITTEVKGTLDLKKVAADMKALAPGSQITLADTREHNRCFLSNFYFVVPGHGLAEEKDDFAVKSIFLPKNSGIGAASEQNETAYQKYQKLKTQIITEVAKKSKLESVYTVYVTA